MAGIFKIHPTNDATITMDTMDTRDTAAYCLASQDLKEPEREKILYSEDKFGGSVIGNTAGLVTVRFNIVINGNTLEEVAQNMATIRTALSNPDGGYIEYRPAGYSASTISTYYKYLKSSPPRVMLRQGEMGPSSSSYSLANLYSFDVKIFALATNNPDDAEDIIASGSCWTYTSGAELGYMIVPESSIKGDGLLPIISVRNASGSEAKEGVVIISSEIETGSEDLDWYDGTLAYDRSNVAVEYSSSEGFYTSSPITTWWVDFPIQETTRLLYGKCTPIISYKFTVAALDIWQIRMVYSADEANSAVLPLNDWMDMPGVTHGLDYWNLIILNSINMPPVPFPEHLPISYIHQRVGFQVRVTDAVARNINIFGVLLPNMSSNGWLAKYDTVNLWPFDALSTASSLAANCISGMSYRYNGVPPAAIDVTHVWDKQGMTPRDAIMPKGTYQVRAVCGTAYGWGHSISTTDNEAFIVVQGLFYTVYPFSE